MCLCARFYGINTSPSADSELPAYCWLHLSTEGEEVLKLFCMQVVTSLFLRRQLAACDDKSLSPAYVLGHFTGEGTGHLFL